MTATLPLIDERLRHHHSHHCHRRKKKHHDLYGMVPGSIGLGILNRKRESDPKKLAIATSPEPLFESEKELKERMMRKVLSICLILILTPLVFWAASNFVHNAYYAHKAADELSNWRSNLPP